MQHIKLSIKNIIDIKGIVTFFEDKVLFDHNVRVQLTVESLEKISAVYSLRVTFYNNTYVVEYSDPETPEIMNSDLDLIIEAVQNSFD